MDKLDQQMQILAQPRHLESVSRKAKTLVGELEKVNELKNKELSNGGFIDFETEEKVFKFYYVQVIVIVCEFKLVKFTNLKLFLFLNIFYLK